MPITNPTVTKFNETQTNSTAPSTQLENNGYAFQDIPSSANINFLFNQWFQNFNFLKTNNFYQWDNTVSYNQNSYVVQSGIIYVSQIDANTGNQPSLDTGTNWKTLKDVLIAKATTLETQTGTDDEKYITPLKLFNSLKGANQSLNSSGYQKLHGGLIIQWGQTPLNSTSANFPIAFPNAFLGISQCLEYNGFSNITGFTNFTTTGFSLTSTAVFYRYIAIGF